MNDEGQANFRRTLVLVPTQFELDHLKAMGSIEGEGVMVALCGFGAIAAAARTAMLIGKHRPNRILLVGIAGTYDEQGLAVGSAGCFKAVSCHGVGKGVEPSFLNPTEMGFPQWGGAEGVEPVFETLELCTPRWLESHGHLLTVTAATDTVRLAAMRRERYRADAEDMEGFGVALAAKMSPATGDGQSTGTPVAIVRGISNTVGQSDAGLWQIEPALEAARNLAMEILNDSEAWESNT